MHRRRVGQIVGRYIYRLDGCDSSGVGIGDALLQPRQLRTHRWLITKARRHLAHQSRLERFLTQPFFTTEQFSGIKGKLVSLKDSLDALTPTQGLARGMP